MMNTAFKFRVKGITSLPIYYSLRLHSICHPKNEGSAKDRQRKLGSLNTNLEKLLRNLIEHMNSTGLILFTEPEDRIRQNLPVIEKKFVKFITDQIQKGLNEELKKLQGSCSVLAVIEKEVLDMDIQMQMDHRFFV